MKEHQGGRPALAHPIEKTLAVIVTEGKRLAAFETPSARREAERKRSRFRTLKVAALQGIRSLSQNLEALAPFYQPNHFAAVLGALRDAPEALDVMHAGKGSTRLRSKRYVVEAIYNLSRESQLPPRESAALLDRALTEAFGTSADEETLLNRVRLARRRLVAKMIVYAKRLGYPVRTLAHGEEPPGAGFFFSPLPDDEKARAREARERALTFELVKRLEKTGSLHARHRGKKLAEPA